MTAADKLRKMARAATPGLWYHLYDNYEAGTEFLTAEPYSEEQTPESRAIEALAEALHTTPGIATSGFGFRPDEHLAGCRRLAALMWTRIDKTALRAALLADVRAEVGGADRHDSKRVKSPREMGWEAIQRINTRLAQADAALGRAWREVEEALPDGWTALTLRAVVPPRSDAKEVRQYLATTDRQYEQELVYVDTPAAALRSLRERLERE